MDTPDANPPAAGPACDTVVLRTGDNAWAVEAASVVEIVLWPRLTAVPLAAPALLGVCLYRGQVVPVLDLAVIAAGSEPRPYAPSAVVVLVQAVSGQPLLGLAADQTGEAAPGTAVEPLDLEQVAAAARASARPAPEHAGDARQSSFSFRTSRRLT